MSRSITPTLAIILAAGLAAGVALARPPSFDGPGDADPAAIETGGYLGSRTSDEAAAPATDQRPADDESEAATIAIAGFDFSSPAVVAPWQVIAVANQDGVPHTLTAENGAFDTGAIGGGTTAVILAPSEPGSYPFFCTIHPSMQGVLTVQQ